jgi:hypothetical protein
MCEVMTIAAVSAMVVGGAMQAKSQYDAGQASAAAADQNAQIMGIRSALAAQAGAAQAGQIRMKGSDVAGEAHAALAKGNVETSSGTPLDTITTSPMTAELDALTAKNNAARAAWGFTVEKQNSEFQADVARRRSILGAAGTMIGTAGAVMGAMRKPGVGDSSGFNPEYQSAYAGFDNPANYG